MSWNWGNSVKMHVKHTHIDIHKQRHTTTATEELSIIIVESEILISDLYVPFEFNE